MVTEEEKTTQNDSDGCKTIIGTTLLGIAADREGRL